MLLRKLTALILSAALVLPWVGCDGGAKDPPRTVDETPVVPDAGEPDAFDDTDSDWDDYDDDTTTGN
jgi:hypothetical protein